MAPPLNQIPYHITIFEPILVVSFSMVTQVLGIDSYTFVTATSLGHLVSLYHISIESCTHFNFPYFLSDEIHSQMMQFEEEQSFHHRTYLVHVFIPQQYLYLDHFKPKIAWTKKNDSFLWLVTYGPEVIKWPIFVWVYSFDYVSCL